MPNYKRNEQIFKDVREKVLKHAYIPKTIRDKYSSQIDKEEIKIEFKQK